MERVVIRGSVDLERFRKAIENFEAARKGMDWMDIESVVKEYLWKGETPEWLVQRLQALQPKIKKHRSEGKFDVSFVQIGKTLLCRVNAMPEEQRGTGTLLRNGEFQIASSYSPSIGTKTLYLWGSCKSLDALLPTVEFNTEEDATKAFETFFGMLKQLNDASDESGVFRSKGPLGVKMILDGKEIRVKVKRMPEHLISTGEMMRVLIHDTVYYIKSYSSPEVTHNCLYLWGNCKQGRNEWYSREFESEEEAQTAFKSFGRLIDRFNETRQMCGHHKSSVEGVTTQYCRECARELSLT